MELTTSKLVGKRLTLSYVPATQADADLIASYLPKPHADGSPILPSELPTSLPGYLIKLKPQITLDGQVVATSTTSVQMGTDLYSTGGFTQLYDTNEWDLTSEESNVAGQATAIGISAGGISANQLTQLKDRLANAKTKLEAKDVTGLTGEQLSGDLLTATLWSWFAAAESHNRLSQNQAGIVENPGLSYGLFHAIAQPVYSWGVIRKVSFPGVNMDIGHVRNLTWAKDNDAKSWVAYNRLRGQYMSALEHAVPDEMFNDPGRCNPQAGSASDPAYPACSQGVSAIKAIALGAQAGQKIYTINADLYANNPNIVNANLAAHSQDTKARIQQGLDVGYEVTVHEAPITQDGWTGSGFTMIESSTGAGGYLIDGGSNGGFKADNEAGTSITYTTLNPNTSAGTAFLMSGLIAQASVSIDARLALGAILARALPAIAGALAAALPVVLTILVVIVILVVIWQMVAAARAKEEDIRQQVINNAATNPLTKDWPIDNCRLVGARIFMSPKGWKRHQYTCKLWSGAPFERFFPVEIPSPTPVPCVPGPYPAYTIPLPRNAGDLVSPDVFQCTVG